MTISLKSAKAFIKSLPETAGSQVEVFDECVAIGFDRLLNHYDSSMLSSIGQACFLCNERHAATKRTYSGRRFVEYVKTYSSLQWDHSKRVFHLDGKELSAAQPDLGFWAWLDAVNPVQEGPKDTKKAIERMIKQLNAGKWDDDALSARAIEALKRAMKSGK